MVSSMLLFQVFFFCYRKLHQRDETECFGSISGTVSLSYLAVSHCIPQYIKVCVVLLSILFVVLVHRDFTLNGSLAFSINQMNKITKAINWHRHYIQQIIGFSLNGIRILKQQTGIETSFFFSKNYVNKTFDSPFL